MNVTSPLTACIPGVNTISGNRIQMSLSYHRQAQSLKKIEYPLLTTPAVNAFAHYSEFYKIEAKDDGKAYKLGNRLVLEYNNLLPEYITLEPYMKILIKNAQDIQKGDLIAIHRNVSLDKGVAFGIHLNVAPLNKYTFEDSIVITESAAAKLESIHFDSIDLPITTKYFRLNTEVLHVGAEIPKGTDLIYLYKSPIDFVVSPTKVLKMPEDGTIQHLEIQMFDDYKTDTNSAEFIAENSLQAYKEELTSILPKELAEKIGNTHVAEFRREHSGIIGNLRIHYTYSKKLKIGDKLTNRYGNKGVVSKILSDEEAWRTLREQYNIPSEFDWFQPEIFINPLGIPRRMNPTQLAEFSLLYVCMYSIPHAIEIMIQKKLSYKQILKIILENVHKILSESYYKFVVSELSKIEQRSDADKVFKQIISDIMKYGLRLELDPFIDNYLLKVDKVIERWDKPYYNLLSPKVGEGCGIGVMYTIKVEHMVHKKLKAISTDVYSTKTKQPLEGQKIGEMELTTITAYDVPAFTWSVLKPRSDEHVSKNMMYDKLSFEGTCSIHDLPDKEARMTSYLKSLLRVIDIEI